LSSALNAVLVIVFDLEVTHESREAGPVLYQVIHHRCRSELSYKIQGYNFFIGSHCWAVQVLDASSIGVQLPSQSAIISATCAAVQANAIPEEAARISPLVVLTMRSADPHYEIR